MPNGAGDQEHSFHLWFLIGVWIAAATIVTFYFEADSSAWHEWPLTWIGAFGLTGVALTVVFGVTFLAHDFWWNHVRGRPLRDLLRGRRLHDET